MIRFSQNDPRWKNEKLGTSQTTIKDYGCLVCCVAMACQAKGYSETPATINAKFKAVGGFEQGNLINLWKIGNAVPGMRYVYHLDCKNIAAPVAEINQFLAQGFVVAALVDYDPIKTGIQPHFVILERQAGDDYLILDPVPLQENGGPVTLLSRFGNGKTAYEAIYEVCVFGAESPLPPSVPAEQGGPAAELPKAGEVWKPNGDYVNDRLQPSTSAADVGDTTGAITLSADAVVKNGEVWLPHQVTITVWSAGWLMSKVSPAEQGDGQ